MTRLTALGLLSVVATGCLSWRSLPPPPAAPRTAGPLPARVRVTLADHTVHELRRARVAGDSLIGYARPTRPADSVRVAVAMTDVRRIEARGLSPLAATGIFFGILFVAGVAAFIVTGGV